MRAKDMCMSFHIDKNMGEYQGINDKEKQNDIQYNF